jgi:hypothetical protein
MRRIFLLFVFTSLFLNCKEAERKEMTPQKKEVKKNIQIEEECLQDFEQFFENFSKDSIFQKSRIKLPLSYISYDYESSEEPIIENITNITNFKYINFSMDSSAMKKEYDKFEIEKRKTKDGMIYKRVGFDNGIYISYEFKIIDKCWYLIKITDEST